MSISHQPVLLTEAVELLAVKTDGWYIDATFGAGGHTRAMLNLGAKVVAFDFDQQAIQAGHREFATALENQQLILVRENFDHLVIKTQKLITQHRLTAIQGVLFDFGTSSQQLTSAQRGLSFQGNNQELDMRLDDRLGVKAKDLLAVMSRRQLQLVFSRYGGEREAKRIAEEIVRRRQQGELITTIHQLVALIVNTKHHSSHKIHPATKVFQALRIAVNDELANIERALPQALEVITGGGRVVTIAFHEGEDRIVKHAFRDWQQAGFGTIKTDGVITPTSTELERNPRARSAKLRAFEKKT